MKYIHKFANRFKAKRSDILPQEPLYTELTHNEYLVYVHRGGRSESRIQPTKRDISILSKFLKSKSWSKSFKLITKSASTRDEVDSFVFYDYIKIIPPSEKIIGDYDWYGKFHKKNKVEFEIKCFSDYWYTCRVLHDSSISVDGARKGDRYFKCDTLDGIKQLLNKYQEFNSN